MCLDGTLLLIIRTPSRDRRSRVAVAAALARLARAGPVYGPDWPPHRARWTRSVTRYAAGDSPPRSRARAHRPPAPRSAPGAPDDDRGTRRGDRADQVVPLQAGAGRDQRLGRLAAPGL